MKEDKESLRLFLKENNLLLKDVAKFFEMSADSFRNSTAKDRYITALKRYDQHKQSKHQD